MLKNKIKPKCNSRGNEKTICVAKYKVWSAFKTFLYRIYYAGNKLSGKASKIGEKGSFLLDYRLLGRVYQFWD